MSYVWLFNKHEVKMARNCKYKFIFLYLCTEKESKSTKMLTKKPLSSLIFMEQASQ